MTTYGRLETTFGYVWITDIKSFKLAQKYMKLLQKEILEEEKKRIDGRN